MALTQRSKTELSLNDDVCPVCKTDRYLNPDMKLLVSPCYHKMCENCVNRLFTHGANPCPICGTLLRKSNFVKQIFEDLVVEKEIRIRKEINKYMNKRAEDFSSLRAYNDYLEELEDLTFKLAHDKDVQKTYEQLEKFRVENQELYARNVAIQLNEKRAIEQHLEEERRNEEELIEADWAALQEIEHSQRQQESDIINQLASSDQSAERILDDAQRQIKRLKAPSMRQSTQSQPQSREATWFTTLDVDGFGSNKKSAMAPDDALHGPSAPFHPLEHCRFPPACHVRDRYEADPLLPDAYLASLIPLKNAPPPTAAPPIPGMPPPPRRTCSLLQQMEAGGLTPTHLRRKAIQSALLGLFAS